MLRQKSHLYHLEFRRKIRNSTIQRDIAVLYKKGKELAIFTKKMTSIEIDII